MEISGLASSADQALTETTGKGNSTSTLKRDLDRNNTRIRQGIDKLRGNNKRARDNIDRAGQVINRTRRSVSDIIRDAKKDSD